MGHICQFFSHLVIWDLVESRKNIAFQYREWAAVAGLIVIGSNYGLLLVLCQAIPEAMPNCFQLELWTMPGWSLVLWRGIILCMHSANERWRYSVTPSLIGWAHTQNDPCSNKFQIKIQMEKNKISILNAFQKDAFKMSAIFFCHQISQNLEHVESMRYGCWVAQLFWHFSSIAAEASGICGRDMII